MGKIANFRVDPHVAERTHSWIKEVASLRNPMHAHTCSLQEITVRQCLCIQICNFLFVCWFVCFFKEETVLTVLISCLARLRNATNKVGSL